MTRVFAVLWIMWIAYFGAVEGAAFIMRRYDLTLSDFTWRLEGTGWTAARYFVAAGLLWAFFHLVWGMFR